MERELEQMVTPVVEAAGLELVEVTFRRESGGKVLRLTVDREGGIDLDTIADTSERVSRRLDVEGFDPGPYRLEVSSPGVERPLRDPADFARRLGQKVKVRAGGPGEDQAVMTGTLVSADQDAVTIATEAGERRVAHADITSARTVFEWGPKEAPRRRRK
jgi:ribosome maturation factor RimP